MEDNLTPEQQQQLLSELEMAQQELQLLRDSQTVQQVNPQDKFIETLLEKGGEIFMGYSAMKAESTKHEIERQIEVEKQELKTINQIDTKEKLYKGILIILCIVALVLVPLFVSEAQMIIPVLSLIVGLLFKSNSVTDFIKFRRNNNEDYD